MCPYPGSLAPGPLGLCSAHLGGMDLRTLGAHIAVVMVSATLGRVSCCAAIAVWKWDRSSLTLVLLHLLQILEAFPTWELSLCTCQSLQLAPVGVTCALGQILPPPGSLSCVCGLGWGVMCHYSVVGKLWELASEVPEALELQVLILFSYLSLPSFPSFSCSQFLEENKVIRRNILCFSFGIFSSLCCLVGGHVRNTHKKGSEVEFSVRNSGGDGKTSGRQAY